MTHTIDFTFTGVDEHTDIDRLLMTAWMYPNAEFAVLVSSNTGLAPIYPSTDFVERFRDRMANGGGRSAIHLCGRYARMACHTNQGVVDRLVAFVTGFGRVQVNMSSANQASYQKALSRFAERVPGVVLQHRGSWDTIPIDHPRIEYLFDRSGGRGVESFPLWPDPPIDRRVGYAGGIGPDNVGKALAFAARFPDAPLWFDMERQLRTGSWFDIKRVEDVLETAATATEGD